MRSRRLWLGAGLIALSCIVGAPRAALAAKAPPEPFIAADVIASETVYSARQRRLDALQANAAARDANGWVEEDWYFALEERDRCGSRACLNAWYAREESQLAKWEGAEEILAQPPR